jgi:hypothetical protein
MLASIGSRNDSHLAHPADETPPLTNPSPGASPHRAPGAAQPSTVEPYRAEPQSEAAHQVPLAPRLEALLTTDVTRFDFIVTEGEARQALELLRGLAPDEFREALAALEAKGLCKVLVDHLSWDGKCELLQIAWRAGVIEREPGEQPTGVAAPPKHPDLYRQSVRLPRALNDLIHEHSQAAIIEYKRAYDEYITRYSEAVARCNSLREIRALGPPARPTDQWEYTDANDPHAARYHGDWGSSLYHSSPLAAYKAVSDRMQTLTGERRDGSAWFELKVEGQVAGLAWGADVVTGDPRRGPVQLNLGAAVSTPTEDWSASGKVMTDGSRQVTVGKSRVGAVGPVSASVTFDADHRVKQAGVTMGIASVVASPGRAQLSLSPVRADVGKAKAELGSVASLDARTAELRGAVAARAKVGSVLGGRLQVGFGLRGLSANGARRALGSEGVFERRWPELERGTPWAELPKARRATLEALGWDETEWNAELRRTRGDS